MLDFSWEFLIRCVILAIIWASLLMPLFFSNFKPLKYFITIVVLVALLYFLSPFSGYINKMTVIAIIALLISFIISPLVFDKDQRTRPKAMCFTCVTAAFAYLASVFVSVSFL